MRDEGQLEQKIMELLADPQHLGHPLQEALAALFAQYQEHITQIERLTSISDGYQSVMRERNQSLSDRYRKQLRQLQKIVRISDHYQEMMRDLNQALKIASTQDPLTGLPNRRLMYERLDAQVALATRFETPFCLALIDVDHFKKVNDAFGHDVGDQALVCIAKALTHGLRAYDVCARWGGEEFLVLLPETTSDSALASAERLRLHVENLHYPELPDEVRPSISIGVAQHQSGAVLAETIKRADMALYEAKHTGRNRVSLAQ
jgi:diguanylate cyclase (GGDEF)-like protein